MFLIQIGCCLTYIAFIVFFRDRNVHDPDKKFVFMEMLADIKDTRMARAYTFMLLGRRTIFILIIVFMVGEVDRSIIYLCLASIQVVYFLFVVSLHCLLVLDYHTPVRRSPIKHNRNNQ
jgi:hypothetical protein